jgi:HK97 family phage major capsid protein
MPQSVRERLKAVRSDLQDARAERATAITERNAARDAFAGAELSDGAVTQSAEFKAAEQAVAKVGGIEDRIADLELAERGILGMLGDGEPPSNGNGNRGGGGEIVRRAWDARQMLAEGAYQQHKDAGTWSSSSRFGSVSLGEVADREVMAAFLAELPAATPGPYGSGTALGATPTDQRGFVLPLLRPLRLLDLIPTGTTDATSVEYVQVTALPQGAVETAELAAKPELGLTTIDATAPVRTIAGWIKLARQALDDIAGLSTLINTLLPREVRRRIEAQMLAGDGAGQNLRGILNTTGIGAPTFVAGDNVADAVLRAMTTVILSEGEPNFAAVNPLSWQEVMLMRENADRSGMYLAGGPVGGQAPTLWGMALITSTIIPAATPLVGDANGATLLVREGVNVKISDSDQDDFVRNRVTVLAEARVAFPVWRPASFAVADTTV